MMLVVVIARGRLLVISSARAGHKQVRHRALVRHRLVVVAPLAQSTIVEAMTGGGGRTGVLLQVIDPSVVGVTGYRTDRLRLGTQQNSHHTSGRRLAAVGCWVDHRGRVEALG